MAGEPRKVVEWVIFKEVSPFLFESFMRVYPLYKFTPETLFDTCKDIYFAVPRDNREQVSSFLVDWVSRRYLQDFKGRSRQELFQKVMGLIPSEQQEVVLQVKEKGDRQYPSNLDLKPTGGVLDKKKVMQFSRWSSKVFCETLTLIAHEIFCVMPPHELCGDTKRTFLNKQINFFSRLSNLVVWSVVKAVFPMALLKKFIKIAHIFYTLNNYHFLGAIITGLNSGHVQALKQVWNDLPEQSRKLFEKYEALVSPMRNFAAYRAHLETVPREECCYPYLAVLMRDLTYINDGNPDFNEKEQINYTKISMLGSFIEEWRVFQTRHYGFTPNLKIVQWMGELELIPDMSNMLLDDDDSTSSSAASTPTGPASSPHFLLKASGRIKTMLSPKPQGRRRSVSIGDNSSSSAGNSPQHSPTVGPSPPRTPSAQSPKESHDGNPDVILRNRKGSKEYAKDINNLVKAATTDNLGKNSSSEKLTPALRSQSSLGKLETKADMGQKQQSEGASSEENKEGQQQPPPLLKKEDVGKDLEVGVGSKLVSKFIREKGLQKYERNFQSHSIRRGQLKELNEYDLIAMGVTNKEDRVKLKKALKVSEDNSGTGGSSNNSNNEASSHDVDVSEGSEEDLTNVMPVRVSFEDDIKVVKVAEACSIEDLVDAIAKAYNVNKDEITVKLQDFEGDLIRLKKQTDLEYALLHCRGRDKIVFQIFKNN